MTSHHAAVRHPLTSWADGPPRHRILDFVSRVTDENGDDFVPPPARVAVFDNDGTLWCEKPMPIQLDFTIRRLAELAPTNAVLGEQQPYKAAFEGDLRWFGAAMVKHYQGDDGDLRLLMAAVASAFDSVSVESYDERVSAFFHSAVHPTLGRPYLTCGFVPMIELLQLLEEHGFTNYVASGGDRDFMRPIAERLYGVPPERIIGSALGITYSDDNGGSELLYKNAMEFFDDGPEKPIRIWSRIGRRPILSVGNSNGDLPMLAYSGRDATPALRLVVLHDDADREFDYVAGAEEILAHAGEQGWTVVSMRNDWSTLFADIPA
jgi:phosphoserine phosphatase